MPMQFQRRVPGRVRCWPRDGEQGRRAGLAV